MRTIPLLLLPLLALSSNAVAETQSDGSHILYSQTVAGGDIAIVSQVFDTKHANLDSQGADDFVVPSSRVWVIKSVSVGGAYDDQKGYATSENVLFYHDRNGRPGKAVRGGTFLNVGGLGAEPNFHITLPGRGLKLHAGTYWVSVQANMPYKYGFWVWTSGDPQQEQGGNPAVWENPANGWKKGCTKWKIETKCWPAGQGPGKYFILYGASKQDAP
jgi:hypothetical protein